MTGTSNRIKVYQDLVEFVLGQHKDLVSLERLNLFLGKSKKRYPQLGRITIKDDFSLKFSDDFFDDEDAALRSLSVVIACAYKVLEMFVGSGTARERVLASVDKFKVQHPELDSPDLKKYLPKRGESEEKEDATGTKPVKDKDIQDLPTGPNRPSDNISTEDILRPKDEGLPFYDETRKEWVIKPASEVKKFKDELKNLRRVDRIFRPSMPEDAREERRKMWKRAVTRALDWARPGCV